MKCKAACKVMLTLTLLTWRKGRTPNNANNWQIGFNPQATNVIHIYGAPILDVSRSHTTTHHSRQDSSGRVISSSQRPLPNSRLLRSWVRIPPGAWIFVCCECCVQLGRGLCDELINRPEESYRLWCVVVCDLETSRIGAPYIYIYIYI